MERPVEEILSNNSVSRCRSCGKGPLQRIDDFSGFPNAAQGFYSTRQEALLHESQSLTLWQCPYCRLHQIDIPPVDYYKSVITASSLSKTSREMLKSEWSLIRETFKLQQGARVLEVGAGSGSFVELMNEIGFDCKGLEYQREEVQNCDIENIIPGYLPGTQLEDRFSLVVCNNFLEHHPRPLDLLNSINRILTDDGILYVSVPRFEYLVENEAYYELIPDHLSYFTEYSLSRAILDSNFRIEKYYIKNNGNDHVVLARKIGESSMSFGRLNFDSTVASLNALVSKITQDGQSYAIWGAGHRAISLMIMAGCNCPEYVVDSAPFKQGKFITVLGHQVRSPQDFLSMLPDNLIIMLPGSYSEQVIAFLNEHRVDSVNIYNFRDSPDVERVILKKERV